MALPGRFPHVSSSLARPAEPEPDLEALAVRADALAQAGDPRGPLLNAELAGVRGFELHRLTSAALSAMLGPLVGTVDPLQVRHARVVVGRLRRAPTARQLASAEWKALRQLDVQHGQLRRHVPRGLPRARVSTGPMAQGTIPWRRLAHGLDRQLWLGQHLASGQPVILAFPTGRTAMSPPTGLQPLEQVMGAEVYPLLPPVPALPCPVPDGHPLGLLQSLVAPQGPVILGSPPPGPWLPSEIDRLRAMPRENWAGWFSTGGVGAFTSIHVDGRRAAVVNVNRGRSQGRAAELSARLGTGRLLETVTEVLAHPDCSAVVAAERHEDHWQLVCAGGKAWRLGGPLEAIELDQEAPRSAPQQVRLPMDAGPIVLATSSVRIDVDIDAPIRMFAELLRDRMEQQDRPYAFVILK